MSAVRGAGRNGFVLGLVLCLGWLSGCAGPVAPASAPEEEAAEPGVARAAVTAPTWTVVRAGRLHSLGLQADGTVWAWGRNRYGQLGNNTTTDRLAPVKVTGLTGVVVDIAAGNEHSLALKADGTVWAWGLNDLGQLGDNSTTQRLKPVKVSGLTGVAAVAAGYRYSLALKTDGTVWAWGDNDSGKLGDGTRVRKLKPVQVVGLTGVAGVSAGYGHSLAFKTDGTVWGWGSNSVGALGDGTNYYERLTPVQTSGLSGVVALAARSSRSFALKSDGTVWAW
ncbi:RCC1 domain-containing protein, partial [Corallococcus exiguus]|uniref:RCC1 domain-containing protein n=1 Tax=Corallococcus exiguus TaxID=83462 RepID=UPI00353163DF|nr:RCC1 repeat-containing protein [Corallococcus exiguus]